MSIWDAILYTLFFYFIFSKIIDIIFIPLGFICAIFGKVSLSICVVVKSFILCGYLAIMTMFYVEEHGLSIIPFLIFFSLVLYKDKAAVLYQNKIKNDTTFSNNLFGADILISIGLYIYMNFYGVPFLYQPSFWYNELINFLICIPTVGDILSFLSIPVGLIIAIVCYIYPLYLMGKYSVLKRTNPELLN